MVLNGNIARLGSSLDYLNSTLKYAMPSGSRSAIETSKTKGCHYIGPVCQLPYFSYRSGGQCGHVSAASAAVPFWAAVVSLLPAAHAVTAADGEHAWWSFLVACSCFCTNQFPLNYKYTTIIKRVRRRCDTVLPMK
jgi:hypothetical protein